ncbi:MAG: FAD-dependent oxidoreductase [bacterium]|nr:FAD-dependent oxidoreductase [bacterium]
MENQKVYDLIIVGTGPAGISAAIYAFRKNMDFLLIGSEKGGLASRAILIENYPGFLEISGSELVEKFFEHLKKFQIKPLEREITKIEKKNGGFELTDNEKEIFKSKAVLIASGSKPRILNVKGEKEFLGKGVSYCVTCDGPLFKNKKVGVIGGGNSGFSAALWLVSYCSKVYVFEGSDKPRADESVQEQAKEKGVITIINSEIKEIKGSPRFGEAGGKFVKSIVFENKLKKELEEIEIDGIFVEIGYIPTSFFVGDLADYNERGEIKVDLSNFQTKTPGLFAAGDVIDFPFKQIIIAAGQGASATLSIYKFLENSV